MKLNAVNFDGVFNNIKAFADGQSVGNQQQLAQMAAKGGIGIVGSGIGISGIGINGMGFGGGGGQSSMMIQGNSDPSGQQYAEFGAGGGAVSRLESDKNQNTRRPSTKNNGGPTNSSTTGSSQASINPASIKDAAVGGKQVGLSALSGVPKTLYAGANNSGSANLRPPIGGGPSGG